MGRIDWDDLELERGYGGFRAYANTKLAQILFTRELARRQPQRPRQRGPPGSDRDQHLENAVAAGPADHRASWSGCSAGFLPLARQGRGARGPSRSGSRARRRDRPLLQAFSSRRHRRRALARTTPTPRVSGTVDGRSDRAGRRLPAIEQGGAAMQTLFDPAARKAIIDRLAALPPTAVRQWGKMDVAQMLAHCVDGARGRHRRPPAQAGIQECRREFLSRLVSSPSSRSGALPLPGPLRFVCITTRPAEFHTLRPRSGHRPKHGRSRCEKESFGSHSH